MALSLPSLLRHGGTTRLAPCTCGPAQWTRPLSSRARPSPTASTSAVTLDDVPPFSDFYTPTTPSRPAKPPKKGRTLPAPSSIAPRVPKTASPPRNSHQISPYLPLHTRERNHLLSALYSELYQPQCNQDRLWACLAALVQYPSVLPLLPRAHRPTSERTDDAQGDIRRPIPLSLPELRQLFSSFARARPRTRNGLSRLLVVVELLAARALPHDLPAARHRSANPREVDLEQLRGGGVGLRDSDWRVLMQWAALSYRAPRRTHEVAAATSLFTQWTRKDKTVAGGKETSPAPSVYVYNVLLEVGMRARAWDLVDAIEERMKRENIVGDAYTLNIRMRRDHFRGAHIELLWKQFEFFLLDKQDSQSITPMWNTMVWLLAKRGLLIDAQRLYDAMRSGRPTSLSSLRPDPDSAPSTSVVHPPFPDEATYTSLAQAYAFRGDLQSSLLILRDMVSPPLPTSSSCSSRVFSPPLAPKPDFFHPLFRGFATFGRPPSHHPAAWIDPHLLAGKRTPANSRAEYGDAVDVLSSSIVEEQEEQKEMWTLGALEKLFQAFLSLSPPPSSSVSTLPHGGQRSAPSSRLVYWVLLAFERLTGGKSEVVLEVWERLVETFGGDAVPGRRGRKSEIPAWRGWAVDQRVRGFVERHRTRLLAEEEREEREREQRYF